MKVSVLGPVLVSNGSAPVDIGGPRQRRLLAALAVHANRAVSADTLIEIVFEAAPPDGASTTLRSYVARLRRSLDGADGEGAIVTSSPGYLMQLGPDQIDVEEFVAAAAAGRHELEGQAAVDAASTLRRALDLWRGPAYAEFAHEEWARTEAIRLEELRADTEERFIDARLACGLASEVIPDLVRLIEAHPYRERFRAQLMLALFRSGRQPEALRSFERYREHLIDVGLEPSSEITAIERSVAAHDPALQLTSRAGTALRGYRLGAVLGEGAHSLVYRAVQPGVGREVAVKVIDADVADSPHFIRNFDRHAQRVSQLEHPHIVAVHDFWREPSGSYLVTRLLPAQLSEQLQHGPIGSEEAATMAQQLGSALSAAHRVGVVHGAIRPSNVLLDHDANHYLADFGIAKMIAASLADRPVDSSGYESPEALAARPLTPASDQFSLAVLMTHALTGVLPFGRRAIASPTDRLPSVHSQRPTLPIAVDNVLARATAWSAEDRFDSIDDFTEAIAEALGGRAPSRTDGPRANPFRGLQPFTEVDAAQFFGREEIVDELIDRLGADAPRARFVTIVGASGSGKSSVVRAGLIPRLRTDAIPGSADWFIAVMVPGRDPLAELELALRPIAVSGSTLATAGAAHDEDTVGRILSAAVPATQPVLLVVDQLEELFTLTPETERRAFIEGLNQVIRYAGRDLRVVATLRADFYDRPLQYAEFGRLVIDNTVTLLGMTASQLDQVIRGPAATTGVEIETTAATQIIADVLDQPAALPLLQFTLTELFEHREGSLITLESYRELGGIEAAVAGRADEVVDQLDPDDRDRVRRLFLRLITVDANGTATRRRATRTELASLGGEGDRMDRIIDGFGAARLLGFDRDPTTREPTVEVAHEALITRWPQLDAWVAEAGDGIRIRNQLTLAAETWDRDERDEGELYRGGRLEAAVTWASENDNTLTPLERDFLNAGVELEDARMATERARLEREQRSNRRLRGLVVGVGIALVFALAAGFLAVNQRNEARSEAARADTEARRSATRALTAASVANLSVDPELSMLLAVEAVRADTDAALPVALEALHRAFGANRLLAVVPTNGGGGTFSPDGRSLATSGEVWSTDLVERRVVLENGGFDGGSSGQVAQFNATTFSHDGTRIATTGDDGSVRLWDAETGASLATLPEGPGIPTFGVAFSPDDRLVAATGASPGTAVWDVETGTPVLQLRSPLNIGNAPWSFGLAFNPGGSVLAVTSNADNASGVVALWDTTTGELIGTLDGHGAAMSDVAFSPDGSQLYASAWDGTVEVWDMATRELTDTFSADDDGIFSIDVSDDGSRLAIAGLTSAGIWDASTFELELPLLGHVGAVDEIDLSPDGSMALTTSFVEQKLRLWNIADRAESELEVSVASSSSGDTASDEMRQAAVIGGLTERSGAVEFGTAGDTLAIGSGDTATLWSTGGAQLQTFAAPGAATRALAFNADGSLLAAAGNDGASVYEVDTGLVVAEPVFRTPVEAVAWDPNSDRMVVAGAPGAVVVSLDGDSRDALSSPLVPAYDASFSPDGSSIAISRASRVVSPDQADLSASIVEIFDATTLVLGTTISMAETAAHSDRVLALAFSPDGERLATASEDATAVIWDVSTSEPGMRLTGHTSAITDIEFDRTRDSLATASSDGTVKIWDSSTGLSLLTLFMTGPVSDVAYSRDGRYLAATDLSGNVTVFLLDTGELLVEAERRATRTLTADECAQYLPTLECPAF